MKPNTMKLPKLVQFIWNGAKKRTKNAKGKPVKEYYLKKDSKHRIWVKWTDPFLDVLEDDNDGAECKWSAEPQSIFEGPMKKAVKEALEKKVVWPWVAQNDDEASKRRSILKSKGFKEWVNPKAKGSANRWKVRYAIEPKTDTSGQSGSDSDGTSSTTEGGEDEDEDDEV